MDPFDHYKIDKLLELISEAHLKWDYKRSSDLKYLREFASNNFFPTGEYQKISSMQLKREHDNYKQAMTKLLNICPELFQILNDWCKENERHQSLITDEMKKDRDTRYQETVTKLKQQECAVLVFGDTRAGKSTLINTILEKDLLKTSAIKTTFAVCEIRYSPIEKYFIAETGTSQFEEQPFPPSTTAADTTSNRYRFDCVRERYECPINLLEGGIVIEDSRSLNDDEALTQIVKTYMTDCLVFICVINCGITESLQNTLNELKSAGRTSAQSIFFVVTNLDDKEPPVQQEAMNQIHSELKKLWADYDPIHNCCMLNPAKAFRIFSNHHLYERAHYEFLLKFIPFLSNALKIKLQYPFDQLYDIFKRLLETIQIKHKQSMMETRKSLELTQRIKMKKEKFNEVRDVILLKIQPKSNAFSTKAIDTILRECLDPTFKDKLEKYALTITLPSNNPDVQNFNVDSYEFEKKNNKWYIRLTDDEATKIVKRFALSARATSHLATRRKPNDSSDKQEHPISFVGLCQIHLQHRLSVWIQKELTPVLQELTEEAIREIWNICCDDLQTIDNELRNEYQQLIDETSERYSNRRTEKRYDKILQQFTNSGTTLNFFTRAKLSFIAYIFKLPFSFIKTVYEKCKDMTLKDINQDENGFKLRTSQQCYQRIIEELKVHQKKDRERVQKQENKQCITGASGSAPEDENLSSHSYSMITSVLHTFELAYTEMEQLAQTEQTQADAIQWENICTSYKSRLVPLEGLFNGFSAVYLKTWPLQSNHVMRETNVSSEDFYEGCCVYNGQLVMDETNPIPVHIRRLTDKFNVLDVFEECQNLAVTNNLPHILHCYGVYTEDSKLFVVTERIHRTLETMLSDKSVNSLETNEKLQLALELAQAIQHLYREKIHHCCIHPKSIMITSDQHIKLNMVGNEDDFLYISPECLLSSRDVTSFADDVYSFGLVLYRLFHTSPDKIELFHSGKWLLPSSHTDKTMISKSCYINYVDQNHAHMTFQIPEISPNTNGTVKEVIKACCSVDVQKRPDINVIIMMLSIEKVRINNQVPVPLQNNEIKSYGLLSIDGGGSRGIIAAKMMEILEAKIGKPLWTLFDLAGGTSVGGLLVLSSMKLHTPAAELTRVFSELSSKIFPFSRRLPTTEYSHEILERELKNHFQELRLTITRSSPKLFVVTKRSTDTQPYLLRNYVTSAENNLFYPGCSEWLCSDAARATSAAQTFFTAFKKDGESYTDGGIGFNNPVHLVFEEAQALSTDNALLAACAQKLYHFSIAYIVSIGTGSMPSLPYAPSSVPLWRHVKRLMHATNQSVEQATECENSHREMKKKCQRDNIPYFRFNTPLDERVRLDIGNENDLKKLVELTNQYMNSEPVQDDIQKLSKLIKEK